jgi:hypothetical protein
LAIINHLRSSKSYQPHVHFHNHFTSESFLPFSSHQNPFSLGTGGGRNGRAPLAVLPFPYTILQKDLLVCVKYLTLTEFNFCDIYFLMIYIVSLKIMQALKPGAPIGPLRGVMDKTGKMLKLYPGNGTNRPGLRLFGYSEQAGSGAAESCRKSLL